MGELELKVEVLKLAVQMAEQIGEGKKLAELEPEISRMGRKAMIRSVHPECVPCEPLVPVRVITEGLWAIVTGLPDVK